IGIALYSSNVTLINVTAQNNTQWDIWHYGSNVTAVNFTSWQNNLAFALENVSLKGMQTGEIPGSLPGDSKTIGYAVNATNNSAASWLYINFSYSDSDWWAAGIAESTLRVWKYNASGWTNATFYSSNGVNTTANIVYANITNFASIFAPAGGSSNTTISGCANLNESGVTYLLTSDITNAVGSCMNVTADGVTLDCQGHIIDGDRSGTDYAVNNSAGKDFVTVKNCTMTDFTHGVYLANTALNNTIYNNTIRLNYSTSYGVYISSNSNYTNITSNTFDLNSYAIYGDATFSFATIESNTIANSTSYGVYTPNPRNTIRWNNFTQSAGSAVYLSSNTTVSGNRIIMTGGNYGIYLSGSDDNNITDNFVRAPTGFYIVSGSDRNRIYNNTVWNCTSYGFYISSSTFNNFTFNNITANPGYGVYITSSSHNTTLASNTIASNGDSGTEAGIYITGSQNTTMTGNNLSGNWYNLWVNDYESRQVIDTTNTVEGRPIYWLKDVADAVYDSSTNASLFACFRCRNVTVKDVNLSTRNRIGLHFELTNGSLAHNATANSNYYGMLINASHNNTINLSTANANAQYGIWLASSTSNNISYTAASANTNTGIYLTYTNYTNITGGNISNSPQGIYLYNYNYNNTISGNSISNSTSYGIYFQSYAINNTIYGNNLSSNVQGVRIYSSSFNNTVSGNTIRGPAQEYGIVLESGCHDHILYNNTIINSTYNGIYVYGSYRNNITLNTVVNTTSQDAIYMYSTYNNTVESNTLYASKRYGIRIASSSSNTFARNNITANDNHGIYFDGSSSNTFIGDTVQNNTGYDFYLYGTSLNITGINITSYQNLISFKGDRFGLKGMLPSQAPATPSDKISLGKYVNATQVSTGAWLWLNFSYSDGEAGDESALRIWRYNGTAWTNTTFYPAGQYGVDTTANVVYANITTFSPFGVFESKNIISNCSNLAAPGTYYLNQSLWNVSGTCMNVSADNVTLDCQGYTISGDKSVNPRAINATADYFVIRNCKLYNFSNAIVTYGRYGLVENVTAAANFAGISVNKGANVTIAQSNISLNTHGLSISADNCTVSNTVINNNELEGVIVYTNFNRFINNTASFGRTGFYLYASSGNIFENNTANSNYWHGFDVFFYSNSSTFINNTAQNNSIWDFRALYNSTGNVVVNLTSWQNRISFLPNEVGLKGLQASEIPSMQGSNRTIGYAINATNLSQTGKARLFLNFSYSDADWQSAGIDESTLRIWKYNDSGWTNATFWSVNGVDTANNIVYANITNFASIFAPAGSPIPLSGCGILNETGKTYSLIANITNWVGTCMNVSADNITLDCQGHTIDGDDSGEGSGIVNFGYDGITITGCLVSDFFSGIHLSNATENANIFNNTLTSNTNYGIMVSGSSNNVISNNTFTYNERGIRLMHSRNITIEKNVANLNYLAGISTYNSTSNNLTLNNASLNGEIGIEFSLSHNNTLTNNTVNSNSFYGIYLSSSSNNTFTNNTAQNNTLWDFRSSSTSLNNTVINLTTWQNRISFTSRDVALKGMQSSEIPSGMPGLTRSIGYAVNATNNSADSWLFLNFSYSDSDYQSAGASESRLRIWKYNTSGWTNETFWSVNNVSMSENVVYANITNFASIFAPAGEPVGINDCGHYVEEGATYVMTSDIYWNGTTCIWLEASSTLDCNGHWIVGNNTLGTYGVYFDNANGITVKNCKIKFFDRGIYAKDTLYHNFINNTFDSNMYYGILLQSVGGATIRGNTAVGAEDDIVLSSQSSDNVVEHNVLNGGAMISISGSHRNYVHNNTLSGTSTYGISVAGSSHNNTLLSNRISSKTGAGIWLYNAVGTNLTGNNVTSSEYGIWLDIDVINSTVQGGRITSNGIGIEVEQSSHNVFKDTLVQNNTVYDYSSDAYSYSNTAINMTSYQNSLSFASYRISLSGVQPSGAPIGAPPGKRALGKYVNATSGGSGAWLFINFSYTDSDLGTPGAPSYINESTLFVWKYNETSGAWQNETFYSANGVNTAANYVYANITNFASMFAPFGNSDCPAADGNFTVYSNQVYTLSSNISCTNVIVEPNATLRINNTMAGYKTILINATESIIIHTTGVINAIGTGFAGGTSQQPGTGPGGGRYNSSYGGGGAGYGGRGGYSNDTAGLPYGSSLDPSDLGSGGGGGSTTFGGAGGGSVFIRANRTVINGTITVRGGKGGSVFSPYYPGGGGSGGTINILTGVLEGAGSLIASGGEGGNRDGSPFGGGGAGGRIIVRYNTSTFPIENVNVSGGAGSLGNGEPGTA
ncbi:MAG: NosD domain-containing protein, partial [Candidatus Aenigmatarchaeota archaeon]